MSLVGSVNLQFWLLTFGLVFFWAIVLSTASPSTQNSQHQLLPTIDEKELRSHERNCKALCKQCGCMGFYCGEECICECNNDNTEAECLGDMQRNAKKLNIPFQLLIQGPSRNRFVRNAMQYSRSRDRDSFAAIAAANRNRRSTVTIYKPHGLHSLNSVVDGTHKYANKNKDGNSQRHKRAVGQLDWFTDIANTLVRPAPLIGRKKSGQSINSGEMVAQAPSKRVASKNEMDRSWFADNPSLLLRPAPLFKRQRTQKESDTGSSSGRFIDDDGSYESPVRSVGKLPKALQDALRSIQETAIGSETANELGDTLRSHIQEGANVLQSQLVDNNLEFLPGNGALRDNLQQTLSQIFPTTNSDNESPPPSPPRAPLLQRSAPPKLAARHNKFTWFRPVRFLQRVQQAIN